MFDRWRAGAKVKAGACMSILAPGPLGSARDGIIKLLVDELVYPSPLVDAAISVKARPGTCVCLYAYHS